MLRNLWSLLLKRGDRTLMLKGKRCVLRSFKTSDAYALAQLVRNNKYYWSTFEPLHREEYYTAESQYKKIVESINLQASNREYSFAILDPASGQIIGHISLYSIKRLPYSSAFVGYSVDKNFIGKGIATEAVELVLQFAFESVNIHRVEAYVSPANKASVKVLEKSGLIKEGLLRKLLFINGEWVDHYMYAILKDDYMNNKKA